MADSPWGPIQDLEYLAEGIDFAMTASHGGIRVTKACAEESLTAAARRCAINEGDYYFFEEDCNYAIVLYELPQLRRKALGTDIKDHEGYILRSLKAWNVAYLKERGLITEVE